MRKRIVDVINFNADASCLSSAKWLSILEKQESSLLFQWLQNYVTYQKKICLGFTAATISDLANFNPECIELINNNRSIFEILLRPYSHDMGLLRSSTGFEKNLYYGKKVIEKEFSSYIPYYLPPEFMLTNEQLYLLHQHQVQGTFIKPMRFNKEIKSRIPTHPYTVKGLYDSQLNCISFNEFSYHAYLRSIQLFDNSWNDLLISQEDDITFSWRDGESAFFLDQTVEREAHWLKEEHAQIDRLHLSECLPTISFDQRSQHSDNHYEYYPVHSISPWMREMKMMGFISRLQNLETKLTHLSKGEMFWWLQAINSDILSAIEKNSPVIQIKNSVNDISTEEYFIWRSERGMEGEEILSMLEFGINSEKIINYIDNASSAHIIKLKNRVAYLNKLDL